MLLAIGVAVGVVVLCPAAFASVTVRFTTVLKDDQKTSSGFTLREDVLQNGRKVGTDTSVCRFYPPGADQPTGATCKIRVTLPSGTIRMAGLLPFDEAGGYLIVTGGTGRFAHASGGGAYHALSTKRTAVTLYLG